MHKLNFDKVEILVVDPEPNTRATIRNLLLGEGFRNVKLAAGMSDIMCEFQISMPDMIISDIKLEDGDFNKFVYRLRHHEIGDNPFLPIIATAYSPTTKDIQAVVRSGSDDIVTKPLSSGQLLQRIKILINSRKIFMVTSSYIGPYRRKSSAAPIPGQTEPKTLEVPNVLRVKTMNTHNFNNTLLQQEIRDCINRVNLHKLESHANQTSALVERIVPGLAFGPPDKTTTRALQRLRYVSEDIARRMVGTKFDHVSELCQSLIEVTKRIIDAGEFPVPKDVGLLKPLSSAITRGFNETSESSASTVHKISQSISTKH